VLFLFYVILCLKGKSILEVLNDTVWNFRTWNWSHVHVRAYVGHYKINGSAWSWECERLESHQSCGLYRESRRDRGSVSWTAPACCLRREIECHIMTRRSAFRVFLFLRVLRFVSASEMGNLQTSQPVSNWILQIIN